VGVAEWAEVVEVPGLLLGSLLLAGSRVLPLGGPWRARVGILGITGFGAWGILEGLLAIDWLTTTSSWSDTFHLGIIGST
jgi:hypothetical protein